MRVRFASSLRLAAVLALLPALLLAGGAGAAESPALLAVVDVQKVLAEAEASKQARQTVEARRASYERDLEAQKQQLQAEQERLQKQRTVLAPDALAQAQRDLEQRLADVRRQTDERRALLQDAMSAATAELRKEMSMAVAEVMKSKGIELTLPRSAVLVFDNRLDITGDVVEALNKRLPKIDLPLN